MNDREIKFRAWNTIEKKYIPNGVVWHWELGRNENDVESYPLEQYTGIKDVNDVEVYEGDVLKDEYNNFGVVKFEYGRFIVHESGQDTDLQMWLSDCYGQVSGNVHENPELLGED